MANNYRQFATTVAAITPEEHAWLERQLDLECSWMDGDEFVAMTAPLDAAQTEAEAEAIWTSLRPRLGFEWPVPLENFRGPYLDFSWAVDGDDLSLYAEESGNIENVAAVMRAFLARWSPDQHFTLTWADTCSKMRDDEFSGGAVFVTKDRIEYFDATDWVARKVRVADAARARETAPTGAAPVDREIAIEDRYTEGGKGRRTPHLVVSLDCLANIFAEETALLDPRDVPGLLASLCARAELSGQGDTLLAGACGDRYSADAYCGECDSQPCRCKKED